MTISNDLSDQASEVKHVLVTGATGQQGGALARLLLRRGHHVRAMTRKPDGPAAAKLRAAGADVVAGDFGVRASIERAAKGVDVAFIVATPYGEGGPAAEIQWGKTGVEAVHAAGVPYTVYSSVSDANRKTGIPHFDSKFEIEERLKSLDADYSIIAPVFFMENFFAPWATAGYAKGVLAMGIPPDRKLQVISLPEIAEFTALAVEHQDSFRGKRTDIASDEVTPTEVARRISEAARARLAYFPVPLDQVRKQSEDFAKMYDWFNRIGYSVNIPRLKRENPQVHWTTFQEWVAKQDWSQVLHPSAKS